MNITDAQKQTVAQWIQQGLKLSDIQSRLDTEMGLRMTYMEVKFLLADLELKPKDQEPPKGTTNLAGPSGGTAPNEPLQEPPLTGEDSSPTQEATDLAGGLPPAAGRNVSVSLDAVTRPGALASGKVTFSDQKTAEWYLDQYGRLGLAPTEKGYKPSQPDLMAFQGELQNQLARLGY